MMCKEAPIGSLFSWVKESVNSFAYLLIFQGRKKYNPQYNGYSGSCLDLPTYPNAFIGYTLKRQIGNVDSRFHGNDVTGKSIHDSL